MEHCIGTITLGARSDPAFVPPPPAVSPLLGPIAPQRPLTTAPDVNHYIPKRLVVAEEEQAEAPAAPAFVDPPVVPAAAEHVVPDLVVAQPSLPPLSPTPPILFLRRDRPIDQDAAPRAL